MKGKAGAPAPAAVELARFALQTGAFRLTPKAPVRWASGYMMPVYTDNRLILRSPRGRELVREGMLARLTTAGGDNNATGREVPPWDAVAGTASAGIAPAVLLAEALKTDFLYVRSDAKGHGLQRQIEGLTPEEADAGTPLAGKRVLLVEDLLSTGGSSAAAARALIEAGAEVPLCLAIFSYGFDRVEETFSALPRQDGGRGPECRPLALLTLDVLLGEALSLGCLNREETVMIEEWRGAPFEWGAKHDSDTQKGDAS
ncbi:MAG: orotate phosphoribosyltransferase [Spirochaetaceae bacterium]|nr:MAG: orotate phosphoribosyltransferase [Spirochaetaceae bacterium]